MENNKQDWLDRKIQGFLNIVKAMGQDSKTVILTGSIILNFYLVNKLITTTEDLNKAIATEIRKQVPAEVRKETTEQLAPAKSKIDSTVTIIRESLQPNGGTPNDK